MHSEQKPAYDEEVRKEEVSRIHDDQILREVITGDDKNSVKRIAIRNLSHQSQLLGLIRGARAMNRYYYWEFLVDNLTDQEVILEAADEERLTSGREKLLSKITDNLIVKEWLIRKETVSENLVNLLLERLGNQDLYDIFCHAVSKDISKASVKFLTDPGILEKIISENPVAYTWLLYELKDRKNPKLKNVMSKLKDAKEKKDDAFNKGGYICISCGKENLPDAKGILSCQCMHCQAENHKYEVGGHVQEYRDYEVGERYYVCSRCGKKKGYRTINTFSNEP